MAAGLGEVKKWGQKSILSKYLENVGELRKSKETSFHNVGTLYRPVCAVLANSPPSPRYGQNGPKRPKMAQKGVKNTIFSKNLKIQVRGVFRTGKTRRIQLREKNYFFKKRTKNGPKGENF